MVSAIEQKILDDFQVSIAKDDAVSGALATQIMTAVQADKLPTADALYEIIKSNAGDITV